MQYITDGVVAVCLPYSKTRLKEMLVYLNLEDRWYKGPFILIPIERVEEIEKKCSVVTTAYIESIIGVTIPGRNEMRKTRYRRDYVDKNKKSL